MTNMARVNRILRLSSVILKIFARAEPKLDHLYFSAGSFNLFFSFFAEAHSLDSEFLGQIAVAQDCGRFEWSVLDWNTPTIALYDSLGARPQSEWIRYRLTGAELQALADGARPQPP